jgi:hypothetical protein
MVYDRPEVIVPNIHLEGKDAMVYDRPEVIDKIST